MPPLRIENLSKTYVGGVQALKDVTLEIPTGMFGLLGPNGAGKSTLMRTIATLQDPDGGRISFGELDVLRDKEQLRRRLGYLPQEFGLYPKVSPLRLLDHFALLKGLRDAKERRSHIEALLKRTNLWDVRLNALGTFSGGMKQRFGIAQALLGEPQLIIVDEPTAGLDPEERNRFHNLLAEIGEQVVVILSTHIVEDVSQLCERMAIIDKGRVLFNGRPGEAVEAFRGKVWRTVVDRGEASRDQDGVQVLATTRFAGKLALRVLSASSPGDGFMPAEPDLEDVYFATIRFGYRGGAVGAARPVADAPLARETAPSA